MEPNVYGEFQLPEDIWEDGEHIVIVEHNDIYNDPIYQSLDDDISDEQEDGYQEDDDYEQVDGYVGQDYESEDSAYGEGNGSTHNDHDDSDIQSISSCYASALFLN